MRVEVRNDTWLSRYFTYGSEEFKSTFEVRDGSEVRELKTSSPVLKSAQRWRRLRRRAWPRLRRCRRCPARLRCPPSQLRCMVQAERPCCSYAPRRRWFIEISNSKSILSIDDSAFGFKKNSQILKIKFVLILLIFMIFGETGGTGFWPTLIFESCSS
jgi:hypothetical protein